MGIKEKGGGFVAEKNKIGCPLCGGSAELTERDISLLEGKVILKSQPFYKCSKCNERFATSKQVEKAEKELRAAFFFKRKVISTGGSMALTVPGDIAKFYHLHKGSSILLVPENEKTFKVVVEN